MDSFSALGDLDGDHVVDTVAVDVDGDGRFDVQYTDTNHDAVADVIFVDADGDGLADQVYTLGPVDPGQVHGPFDTGPAQGPFDAGPAGSYAAAPATGAVAGGPFPGGDTGAVLGNLNDRMADAGLIIRDAKDPGSVDQGELDAATERSANAARNGQAMQGHIYQQDVSNDIHQGDLDRQYTQQAHQDATDAAIDGDRAESRADWAVWNSRQERGA
jgi:hypothetical protein